MWILTEDNNLVSLLSGAVIFIKRDPGTTRVMLHIGRWDAYTLFRGSEDECVEWFNAKAKGTDMSWEAAKQAAEEASGGKFFKLSPNQKAQVVFAGIPVAVQREFDGKTSTRIAINVINLAKPDEALIWEMSPGAFKGLDEVVELKGQECIYQVKRTGEGFQTKYSFIHVKDLTDEQKKKIAAVELHDLLATDEPTSDTSSDEAPVLSDYAARIYQHYEANRGEPRTYLGGSIIGYGRRCKRQLWYRMREAFDGDGRVLRLLDHGNSEEDRLIRDLRAAGYQVIGEQLEATAAGGRFKLHIDGLIVDERGLAVLEVKTSNKKRYDHLVDGFTGSDTGVAKKALASWDVHYCQMQVAMGLLGLRRAVYALICKDDDRLHFEQVAFDADTFRELRAIMDELLSSDEMPARAVKFPDRFGVCQFCPGFDDCWANGELTFNW